MSKLTSLDSQKFNVILKDVFLGVNHNENTRKELEVVLEASCIELGLRVNKKQVMILRNNFFL